MRTGELHCSKTETRNQVMTPEKCQVYMKATQATCTPPERTPKARKEDHSGGSHLEAAPVGEALHCSETDT